MRTSTTAVIEHVISGEVNHRARNLKVISKQFAASAATARSDSLQRIINPSVRGGDHRGGDHRKDDFLRDIWLKFQKSHVFKHHFPRLKILT